MLGGSRTHLEGSGGACKKEVELQKEMERKTIETRDLRIQMSTVIVLMP
jgi:hypothetical protein